MILFFFLLPVSQGEAIPLRWQFKQGDSFVHETKNQLSQVVKVNQQEFKNDIVHSTVIRYTIKEVASDGTIAMEQVIESMKAINPDGSPSPGNNAVFNQLQGTILKVRLTPQLEVKDLEGYDELIKRLAGDDPSVRRVVQALLPEEQLKNAIHHSLGFIPQKELVKGADWKRDMTLSLGPLGSVTNSLAFKFEGITSFENQDLAKISYRPSITYSPPRPEVSNPEMSIVKGTIQLKEGAGTAWFDQKAGRLVASTMNLKLSGNLTVKLQGKEVPCTFEQTQSIGVRIVK